MNEIETFARASVARGSGFAGLAILCLMVALSGMPALALKTGGILCLIGAVVLLAKAERAPHRPYGRTEVWLRLDGRARPSETVAQQVVGGVLRGVYLEFALHFARAAALGLGVSFLINLLG
ncbi:hypothetical protein [Salinarimonas soli]|uniref:Uncharacterized protein n=1 Tax=Salinarimonas soli TaxID=1638099 RepID=A0A5B2VVC7_9HYPH|nr:hypothetical protein [Salinarimonas soli]KAA2242069.1 hypothetical protein F0L46_03645 [Salinarimonas soli]